MSANLTFDCLDPFDLEFSISSPSLIRSYDEDDSDTEVEELATPMGLDAGAGDDSISEMTLTPTPTTIRRIPIQEMQDK